MLGFGSGSAWPLLPLLWCVGEAVAADGPGEAGLTDGERTDNLNNYR